MNILQNIRSAIKLPPLFHLAKKKKQTPGYHSLNFNKTIKYAETFHNFFLLKLNCSSTQLLLTLEIEVSLQRTTLPIHNLYRFLY